MTTAELKAQIEALKAKRQEKIDAGIGQRDRAVERGISVDDAGKWEDAFLAAFPNAKPNQGAMVNNVSTVWGYVCTSPKVSGTFYANGTLFLDGCQLAAVAEKMIAEKQVEKPAKKSKKTAKVEPIVEPAIAA
jgi:hypothetical protein